jgi:hypothetical protein
MENTNVSQHTNIFASAEIEEEFLGVFKSLVDEWGLDNIRVALPTIWEKTLSITPEFKVEFCTFNSVVVLVTPPGESRPVIAYEKQLGADG